MTTVQKIIKYLALAFAVFIIVSIISTILFGIYTFGNILGLTKNEKIEMIQGEYTKTQFDSSLVTTLNINLQASSLEIKKGDNLYVETNRKNISSKQIGNRILIEEKNYNWFSKNNQGKIIVYIPEDILFERVKIETGAGKIDADTIKTKELSLEIGAGKVQIETLEVSEKAKIEGGAGKVDILSGMINNLDLDMGVGKFEMTTKLTGNNKIDAGIGDLNINLTDEKEKYTIKVNKGIGSVRMNTKQIANDTEYGDGASYIRIDGGIGNIDIKTID